MTGVILRGFDFPVQAIEDRLRFCNPLLSFDDGSDAPIYLARHLDWQASPGMTDDTTNESVTLINSHEIESFATLIPRAIEISRNKGVLVMGDRFLSELGEAGISVKDSFPFTRLEKLHCRIAISSVPCFESFATAINERACSVFDGEVARSPSGELSRKGLGALLILRKCSTVDAAAIAIRELAAAHMTGQPNVYDRLLTRYSLEMQTTRGYLRSSVDHHVAECKRAYGTIERFSVFNNNSIAVGAVCSVGVVSRRYTKIRKTVRPGVISTLPTFDYLSDDDVDSGAKEVIDYQEKVTVKRRHCAYWYALDHVEKTPSTVDTACYIRKPVRIQRGNTDIDALEGAGKTLQVTQE